MRPELANLARTVGQIDYKPGWTVRLQLPPNARPFLQVFYDGSGAYGPDPWTGRKWQLSEHMTTTEVVHTAFKAVLAAEEHEARECFRYRGVPVCGPHFDVDQVVAAVQDGRLEADVRTNAMQGA